MTGPTAAGAGGPSSPRRAVWIVVGLLALTAVAYEPVRHNAFISYDDGVYITENAHVKAGLTPDSFAWAFQAGYAGNWHPLTWLSHMLDVTLWGLDPVPHHVTNVVLHAAAAVVLFLLVRLLTRRDGAAAFVAAVFALHPLHVESVAWAAERKDVLSALLGLASLWAWVRWRLGAGRGAYWLAVGLFALGLTAKPMLVSLPAILVLLELLPVLPEGARRGGRAAVLLGRLARDLAPFGVLALVSAWVTVHAQAAGGAVTDVETLSVGVRLANAVTACATYLGLAILPRELAVVYPYPLDGIPAWKLLVSLAVVGGLTAVAWTSRRTRPWFAFGWCWYLVTLLPVIGIVQVGQQAMADRYTYLPLVGVSLAVAMHCPRWLAPRWAGAAAALLAVLWTGLTRQQVELWKDDLTLFAHTVAVTERNYIGHDLLGKALADGDRNEEALAAYRAAIAIRPGYAPPHNNLGRVLEDLGRPGEALESYDEAVACDPGLAAAHGNRGNALDTLGRLDEAERAFRAALRLDTEQPFIHNSLGVTLARQGRSEEAIAAFREAIRLDPVYGSAWLNLGRALSEAGRTDEAIEAVHNGVRLLPEREDARASLENLLRLREMGGSSAPDGG